MPPQSYPVDICLSLFINKLCKFSRVLHHSLLAFQGVSGPHTPYKESLEIEFIQNYFAKLLCRTVSMQFWNHGFYGDNANAMAGGPNEAVSVAEICLSSSTFKIEAPSGSAGFGGAGVLPNYCCQV